MMQYGNWSNGGSSHMASYSGNVLYGWTATGWAGDPEHGTIGSTSYSALYPFGECFNTNVVNTANNSKVKYIGDTTAATQREWVSRINDTANWAGYVDNSAFNSGGYDYLSGFQLNISPSSYSDGEWIGDADSNWFNCANWSNLKVPDENSNVSIDQNAERICIIDNDAEFANDFNDTASCKSLSISDSTLYFAHADDVLKIYEDLNISGGTFYLDSATLLIGGDYLNSSATAFDGDAATLIFNGSALQNFSNSSGTESFKTLILENSYHLQLQSSIEISHLDFNLGKLFLDGNSIQVSDSISGYSNSSYLVCEDDTASMGYLILSPGTSATTFPIGLSGNYLPLQASLSSGSGFFQARVFSNIYENGNGGDSLNGDLVNNTWIFEPVVSSSYTASLTLQWNLGNEVGDFSTDRSSASMMFNDLSGGGNAWSKWSLLSGGGPVQGSNPFQYTQSNITSFGAFGIGGACSINKPVTSKIYHY
jgi:hypothetical protein